MENSNNNTPPTSGAPTPSFPVGGGWGGYYNMYPFQGMMPGMQGMPGGGGMPGMQGGSGMAGVQGMPGGGGMPGMQGMYGMPPWQQGMMGFPGMQGGDNVYRPSLDFLTAGSNTSTPVDTQFTGNETFSLEELGIDAEEADTPIPTAGAGGSAPKRKGKAKGKGVAGESSQPGDEGGAGKKKRTKWTEAENLALSRAWLRVCDDPLKSNNQRIMNLWAKIAAAYSQFYPEGRPHKGEDCRKQWERIQAAVSRFAGEYTKALRMKGSGETLDDVRRTAEKAFPLEGVHKEFTMWSCYEVLMESEKFRAGVEAGWPKRQRRNQAGEYSSSGSHEIPEDPDSAEDVPTPPSHNRRTRPVGQKRAQRAARARSQEVESAIPPSTQTAPELDRLGRIQTQQSMMQLIREWTAASDPVQKGLIFDLIQSMRADLGMPPFGTAGGAGSGQGGGDEE